MKKCDTASRPSTRCALSAWPRYPRAVPPLPSSRWRATHFHSARRPGSLAPRCQGGSLQSFDNDSITRLQAGVEQPVAAERARSFQRPRLDLVIGADHHCDRLALGVARYRLLRHEDRVLAHAFLDHCLHVHVRQQNVIRIREQCTQRDCACRSIDGHVRELQRALLRIRRSIVEQQGHARRIGARALQFAAGHCSSQPKHFRARLRDIHIHRVHLLDRHEWRCLVRRHQSACRDAGLADASGNRRDDFGVCKVDPRRLGGGLRRREVRFVLLQRR